jgi:endonuclease
MSRWASRSRLIRPSRYGRAVRLIVARCQVSYVGRLSTVLPEGVRLLMLKADGTFMVWADGGGSNVKPLNWMIAPTLIEEQTGADGRLQRLLVRKRSQEERLEISIAEVLSDVEHELDTLVSLEKEGLERELQELLADAPQWCGEGLRLVRREWPTDIGPVDMMCRSGDDEWIAVEIKRVATIDAVEQLARYLERIRIDPALGSCRGVLAAQTIKPQARVLAGSRGIECVEVDPEVLRGERQPELKLFAA